MTYVFDDPAEFSEDALTGFCDLHADLVREVAGGAVRRRRPRAPKVAVVYGGGSGHYPAFAGLIGPGMGDGAVVGNIFTSPSSHRAYNVARAAQSGAGVVFSYGNYAGDVMNFGIATRQLEEQGIQVANVLVTDDIASAPEGEEEKRRGIAGDFTVYKVLGAAAERGDSFDEVVRLGQKANRMTRTIGTAFAGCTFPGADEPLFTVPAGKMGLGLGIHGEPGIADVPLPSASELGRLLVAKVLSESPSESTRVAVILNGLGSTKQEELFVLWKTVAPALRDAGLELVGPEVGEIVTSLDMAGVSLTLMYLDDELEELWLAPAHTPAYRRGSPDPQADSEVSDEEDLAEADSVVAGTPESHDAAQLAVHYLEAVQQAIHDAEAELGRIDAVAGDGDHGRGMVKGVDAALAGARAAVEAGAGLGSTVALAGDAWADNAGGTSGVLWGAALRAAGDVLGDTDVPQPPVLLEAVHAFARRMRDLGGAQVGDKTIIDALVPFADALAEPNDGDWVARWQASAATATEAAENSAALRPQKGRARPLAEKSVGNPDPGAVSFALIVTVMGELARKKG